MKNLMILAVLFAQSAFATTMVAECQGEDFYVKTKADLSGKEAHIVELYTQGGLGPNNLESSYVAKKSKLKKGADTIKIDADLPMDGWISITNSTGVFRIPGADKTEHPLSDCRYIFL